MRVAVPEKASCFCASKSLREVTVPSSGQTDQLRNPSPTDAPLAFEHLAPPPQRREWRTSLYDVYNEGVRVKRWQIFRRYDWSGDLKAPVEPAVDRIEDLQ